MESRGALVYASPSSSSSSPPSADLNSARLSCPSSSSSHCQQARGAAVTPQPEGGGRCGAPAHIQEDLVRLVLGQRDHVRENLLRDQVLHRLVKLVEHHEAICSTREVCAQLAARWLAQLLLQFVRACVMMPPEGATVPAHLCPHRIFQMSSSVRPPRRSHAGRSPSYHDWTPFVRTGAGGRPRPAQHPERGC